MTTWLDRCVRRLRSPASRLAAARHGFDERDLETTTVYTVVVWERGEIVRHKVEARSLSMMQVG